MTKIDIQNYKLVFGLDIGTRSIVGIVGYKDKNDFFNILAHHSITHDTRAMIDGQIHDITKVIETVKKVKANLEKQLDTELFEVCIAAAGRVLKTQIIDVNTIFEDEVVINKDHLYSLELEAVEKAHKKLKMINENTDFYCVGFSVIKYYLNDYIMTNLIGHKAKKISANILVTFLPKEVIDSLYRVIENVNLKITSLTLEPIASINIAIPDQYRLLNIALLDIGAGTSDIAITKQGSVIAYGMIPYAGDEITECISNTYLVDFQTAEKIKLNLSKNKLIKFKDIMGINYEFEPQNVLDAIKPSIINLTNKIGDKILELNGNKSTNAVFCVGGGGLIPGFTELLSKKLEISNERVALRGHEVLRFIRIKNRRLKKEPSLVTPIGIALSAYNKFNNFIEITVNGKLVKLFNKNNITIIDVAAEMGYTHKDLFPMKGNNLTFSINGQKKVVKGIVGEPAEILVNEQQVSIYHPVKHKDKIFVKKSTKGKNIKIKINQLAEYKRSIFFIINGQKVSYSRLVKANDNYVNELYEIKNSDSIQILNYYLIDQLLMHMDLPIKINDIKVNGKKIKSNSKIIENDKIEWENKLNKDNNTYNNNLNNIYKKEFSISKEKNPLTVIVNNKPITLTNKNEYIFVDIFSYIDFDLKKPQGKLVILRNGSSIGYTEKLKSGDQIKIQWEG